MTINSSKRKTDIPKTLQECWERASKELTQIKGNYGSRTEKKACALGALSYYCPKEPNTTISELGAHDFIEDSILIKSSLFEEAVGTFITILNDRKDWTFAQFATKAKELGL